MDILRELINLAKQLNDESLRYVEASELAETNEEYGHAEACFGKACVCHDISNRLLDLTEKALEAKQNGDSIL